MRILFYLIMLVVLLLLLLCVCADEQMNALQQHIHHQLEVDDSHLWLVNHPVAFKEANHSLGHQLSSAPANVSYIKKADFVRTLNPSKPKFISTDFEAL